jgi:hypothetical protein
MAPVPVTIANTVTVTYSNTVPVSLNQTVPVSVANTVSVTFSNTVVMPVTLNQTVPVSIANTVAVTVSGTVLTQINAPINIANTVTLPVSIANSNPIYTTRYQVGKATNRVSIATTSETVLVPANGTQKTIVESLTIANADTLPAVVDIRDALNGTIIQTVVVPAVDTRQLVWNEGLFQTTANNVWSAKLRGAIDAFNVDVSVTYRIS